MGSAPTIFASVSDGVTGFMKPAFGLLSFFVAVAIKYSRNLFVPKTQNPATISLAGFAVQMPEGPGRSAF
jgi:hypothetical protein